MADVQTLLSCLDVFSRAPDKLALEQANSFLQDFQHSVIPPFTSSDNTLESPLTSIQRPLG